jgi:hypothetical protein
MGNTSASRSARPSVQLQAAPKSAINGECPPKSAINGECPPIPSLEHLPASAAVKYAMPSALIRFIDIGRLVVPYNWGGSKWFTLNDDKKTGYFSIITRHQSAEIILAPGLEHFAIQNDVLYVASRKRLYKINAPVAAAFNNYSLESIKIYNEGAPIGVYVFGDNFMYHYERAIYTRLQLIRISVQMCDLSKKYGNVVIYLAESRIALAKSHSIFWYSSISEFEETHTTSPQRYWVGAPLIALKIHKNTIAYAYDLKHIHILNTALMTIEIIKLIDCEFSTFIINDVSQSFNPVSEYSFSRAYSVNHGQADCVIALLAGEYLHLYVINKDNKIIGRYSLREKYNNLHEIDGGFIAALEGESFGHLAFYDLFAEKSADAAYLPVI